MLSVNKTNNQLIKLSDDYANDAMFTETYAKRKLRTQFTENGW